MTPLESHSDDDSIKPELAEGRIISPDICDLEILDQHQIEENRRKCAEYLNTVTAPNRRI